MNLIKSLEWRHATKKMNGEKVPKQKLENILNAIQLTSSSMGLQPYTVIVIANAGLKKQILPIAFNHAQVVDCSHLLVFAAWANITPQHVQEYIAHTAHTRGTNIDALADFQNVILGVIERNTTEENFQWAARQAYIAFGTAIAAAAEERVDATPMEGFNAPELDKILGLNEKGLRSVTMLPLGYRDVANDWLAGLPKVRHQKEKLFIVQ